MAPNRLRGIEAGRGVAALLVLGLHARDHLFKNFHRPVPVGDWFLFGHAGVDFFFVLSGFIILYVHGRDIGQPSRMGYYLKRRFTRIYPFYWIVLLLSLAALVASTHSPFPPLARIASSVLLLPVRDEPIVGVAWTLQNEIIFYAVFAILVWNRRWGQATLGLWCALLLWKLRIHPVYGPVLDRFNLEFCFGMGAAWTLQRKTIPLPWVFVASGVVLFLATGLAEDMHLLRGIATLTHASYAVGATLAILGLVETERQQRLRVPRIMYDLGGASYAIYLTHLLTIGAIWQVMIRLGLDRSLPLGMQFFLLFSAGTAVGWTLSHVVERPILSFARRQIEIWSPGSKRIRATNGQAG